MLSFNPQSGSSTGTDNQEIPGKNKCKKEGGSDGGSYGVLGKYKEEEGSDEGGYGALTLETGTEEHETKL